jgi:hypothetical protein
MVITLDCLYTNDSKCVLQTALMIVILNHVSIVIFDYRFKSHHSHHIRSIGLIQFVLGFFLCKMEELFLFASYDVSCLSRKSCFVMSVF